MTAYYNENDPYAAQWLRNLIAAGHIAPGDVDERSIVDVRADDVRGYDQCHWFAGIGGWSLALRLAGWPDDRPVWTGSCPCQAFSGAGKGGGGADQRHLWPHWFRLIRKCRPGIIFGEQVAAAIGWGWLDAVCTDLEAEVYATGACVLGAHSVGAPHIRQRLWFVAMVNAASEGPQGRTGSGCDGGGVIWSVAGAGRATGLLADAHGTRRQQDARGALDDEAAHGGARRDRSTANGDHVIASDGEDGASCNPWANCDWLSCTDGKARPVEPGTFPLASRIPGRVGRLRAYGNAIVPQVAAEFIAACG